jgi:hypothetical protein
MSASKLLELGGHHKRARKEEKNKKKTHALDVFVAV